MANVLLVIGNGFDIQLNLKTTYKEYLESKMYSDRFNLLTKLPERVGDAIRVETPINLSYFSRYKKDLFEKLNFWDLFFGLSKVLALDERFETWSDFERYLYEFLRDDYSAVNIKKVLACEKRLSGYFGEDSSKDFLMILYIYLAQKGLIDKSGHVYYRELLNELKKYEKEFGLYINEQTATEKYTENSERLIKKLIGKGNEIGGIDTFNYSAVPYSDSLVWHINGDVDNPIFGIDDFSDDKKTSQLNFDYYIFTKTYRRLEQYGLKNSTPKYRKHTGVVVYGHSLNEQDYSYYYPLFNQLDFTNSNTASNNGKYIVFKYSVFGNKSSEERREEVIKAVLKMLASYNEEILKEPHFRLMDVLFNQNRIRFEEVK